MTKIKPKHLAGNLWDGNDQFYEDNGQKYRLTDNAAELKQYSVLPSPDIIIGYTTSIGKNSDGNSLYRALGAHMQIGTDRLPGKSNTVKTLLETQDQGKNNEYCDVPQFERTELPENKKSFWQRGHLLARELANINHEPHNFMTLTVYTNTGSEKGKPNGNNPEGMLYYENRLRKWLIGHPNCLLDYAVFPIYSSPVIAEPLAPHQIQLQYCGIDQDGQLIPIPIDVPDSIKSHVYKNAIMSVTLNNVQPGAYVDYFRGIAV